MQMKKSDVWGTWLSQSKWLFMSKLCAIYVFIDFFYFCSFHEKSNVIKRREHPSQSLLPKGLEQGSRWCMNFHGNLKEGLYWLVPVSSAATSFPSSSTTFFRNQSVTQQHMVDKIQGNPVPRVKVCLDLTHHSALDSEGPYSLTYFFHCGSNRYAI